MKNDIATDKHIKNKLLKKERNILHYAIYEVISSIFNHLYYCYSIKNYLKKLKDDLRKELEEQLNTDTLLMNIKKVELFLYSLSLFSQIDLFNKRLRQFSI